MSTRSLLPRPAALAWLGALLGTLVAAAPAQAYGHVPVQAQAVVSTPRVDTRQAHQEARIAQGLASGALTHREARQLRWEQAEIRRAEWQAARDGVVTPHEQRQLAMMQNQASRHIDEQLRDGQRRGVHASHWRH